MILGDVARGAAETAPLTRVHMAVHQFSSDQDRVKRKMLRVLMIEDCSEDAELVELQLAKAGYRIEAARVTSQAAMETALASGEWDVIIADYSVPGFGALPALKVMKRQRRDIPFIIVSGTISDETAVVAMRAGAHDYVVKDNLSRLLPAVEREIQEAAARHQKRQMEAALCEADEAIRVREARLQGIIGSAMDAIISVDEQHRVIVFNQAAEKIFGCPASAALGSPLDRFIPAQYREIHREHLRAFGTAAATTRSMWRPGILNALRSSGEEFPVEATISQVQVAGGGLFTVILRDITERRRTEEALRQSEERLRGMYLHAAVGIEQVGTDGRLLMINPAFCNLLGYSESELLGKTHEQITHPEDRGRESQLVTLMLNGERDFYALEKRYVHKDGSSRWVSVTSSLVRDARAQPLYQVTIIQDIAERKRAELLEDQLRRTQKMEAIGRLAGGVAHDFNNVLGIINTCAEFLGDGVHPAVQQYVDNIKKAIDRGSALTRQLLTFSRTSALKPRILDLNERLKDVSKLLRPLMGDDVEILVVSKSTAPMVEADPGQIDQIVLNLAVNARDAMPRGGKFILKTRSETLDAAFAEQHPEVPPGKYVLLAVSDTGTGMDEATVSHIFEPFFTTKEVGKGTGLGLATVYGIVKQNAGHILVYSDPGHGTTFKIYLPSAEGKIGLESGSEMQTVAPRRKGTTILLVEDDELMRSLTRKLLQDHGYIVIEAEGGRSALGLVQSHPGPIDLLLTDMVMRGMSGAELGERLSTSHPDLKIVFMSGYTGELIAEREMLKRGVVLLEKPITRNTLLNTIHTTLG
jgi:PAS domain S-box-containing protein